MLVLTYTPVFTPTALTGNAEVGTSDWVLIHHASRVIWRIRDVSTGTATSLSAIEFEAMHGPEDTIHKGVDNNYNGWMHDGGGITANLLRNPQGTVQLIPARLGVYTGHPATLKPHRARIRLVRAADATGFAFQPNITAEVSFPDGISSRPG